MKPIAENTYDFAELRKIGAVYVDKTGMLRDLISCPGRKLYFISRPRRFGKSLMISTLRYIFDGRKELFDGLEISKKENGKTEYDWKKYPVLQFSFSGVLTNSFEEFRVDFARKVSNIIHDVGLEYDQTATPGRNFENAIKALAQKNGDGVVLLIDEYDAPIEHALGNYELANAIRMELSNFYIQIKENESCVRFMMMTGVSQFAKMSVFSALSNLSDLSFRSEASALLGYTEAELKENFGEHMRAHAEVMGLDDEAYMKKLRAWCDGYHCSTDAEKLEGVFNPVTIGINMANRGPAFESAWAETGKSTVLMNYLKANELANINYENVENVEKSELRGCDLESLPAVPMLYQSGYLTVKEYDAAAEVFTLRVPNEEVRRDLAKLIVHSQKGKAEGSALFNSIRSDLLSADFDMALEGLRAYFSELPYGPREKAIHEAGYQRVLKTVLSAGGFQVHAEVQQAVGRADVVALHPRGNFVFELKVNDPVELALDQIREKNYTLPYQVGEIPLYAIGLTFDSSTRNVKDMRVERVR